MIAVYRFKGPCLRIGHASMGISLTVFYDIFHYHFKVAPNAGRLLFDQRYHGFKDVFCLLMSSCIVIVIPVMAVEDQRYLLYAGIILKPFGNGAGVHDKLHARAVDRLLRFLCFLKYGFVARSQPHLYTGVFQLVSGKLGL